MAREGFRILGLDEAMKTLRALPSELVSKNGGPVRLALRKAAQVIQVQEMANLRAVILEQNAGGEPSESTGLLEGNIIVKRSSPPPDKKGERYLVMVRRKSYAKKSSKQKETVTTPQIARLLEGGDSKMRPHPFILPAFNAKKREAVDTFEKILAARLNALVRKVAKQNGARL